MRLTLVALSYLFAVAAASSQPTLRVTVDEPESVEITLVKGSHRTSPISVTEVVSPNHSQLDLLNEPQGEEDDSDWRSVTSDVAKEMADTMRQVMWDWSREVISHEIATARDFREESFMPKEFDDLADETPMGKIFL